MAYIQTLLILSVVSFVIGQDKHWNSPNVTACFSAQSVVIDFKYTPPSNDSSIFLVSWYRIVLPEGSPEDNIAEMDDKEMFTVRSNKLVGRLNRTGRFGLMISDLTTGDSGEYSIKLRTKAGKDSVGKGMLKITDPCIKQEEVNNCKKVTCQSSQTNPSYDWMGPKNSTAEMITVCEGDSGTYTCCVTSSSTNCVTANISAPNGASSSDTNTENDDQGPLSLPIIIVIVVGVVLIIVAVVVAVILIKKKRAEKSEYRATATGEHV